LRDVILRLAVFIQYRSVTDAHTQTDKKTDGQTHDDGIYTLSIASRGKNRPYCTAHQVQLPGNERRLIANH